MTERTITFNDETFIGELAHGDGWEEGCGYSCAGCHFLSEERGCQHPYESESGCSDDPVIIWKKV